MAIKQVDQHADLERVAFMAVIVAAVANLLQFVLRKVLQRSLFRSRIAEGLRAM